jgi:hypothetical protein
VPWVQNGQYDIAGRMTSLLHLKLVD